LPLRIEAGIVRGIMDLLSYKGIPFVHVRNGGNVAGTNGRIWFVRQRHDQKGAPDILAWWRGRAFAIEVKAPRGRIMPEQDAFLDKLTRNGCHAFVARSIEDVQREIGI
jgi:hypothetical protein